MVSKILPKLNKEFIVGKLSGFIKHDLFKKIRTAFIYQVLGAIAAFFSNVILARYLGVSTYGVYGFATNLLRLLLIPALLGFSTFTVRYLPRKYNEKQWSHLKGFTNFINVSTVLMSVFIIGISYVIIYHTDYVLPVNRNPYMIFVISLPFYAFVNLFISTAQARHKLTLALMPNYILLPTFLSILNIAVYYTITKDISATQFAWIFLLSNAVIMLYQVIGLWRTRIHEVQIAKPIYEIKEWLFTSLPMLFTSSLNILLKTADVFMIGLLMSSKDVGLYNAALKIDNIVLFGINAVNFVEAPVFSKLYGAGDMKGLQKTVRNSAWFVFVFTILISLPVVIFGHQILALFGQQFEAAYWPLILILIGNAFNALSGSVGLLMSMTNHQKEAFYVTAVSCVICVGLNYFLISSYGILGASMAIAAATIIRNVTMVVMVKRLLNINATVFPF